MSVTLMSLVFNCHMPELKTDDDKTVPDSTAKFILLALADHANDEGEGAYPGVDKLCEKTGFSTATVCNALNALRNNGFTVLIGKSKRDTNNYTISVAKIKEFQWLKSERFSGYNPSVLATETNPSLKPSIKPSRRETPKKGDMLDCYLDSLKSPGAKKSMLKLDIESQIASRFRNNPTNKRWQDFIDYAARMQQENGWEIKTFLDWVTAQRGFDLNFWPPDKMRENYPRAFMVPAHEQEMSIYVAAD